MQSKKIFIIVFIVPTCNRQKGVFPNGVDGLGFSAYSGNVAQHAFATGHGWSLLGPVGFSVIKAVTSGNLDFDIFWKLLT